MDLNTLLLYIRDFVAIIGILVIVIGAVRSLYQIANMLRYKKWSPNIIRLQFGNAVILGLEFMVGADIIGTMVLPDYYNLGILAIVVVIRTILSYFLSKELQQIKDL